MHWLKGKSVSEIGSLKLPLEFVHSCSIDICCLLMFCIFSHRYPREVDCSSIVICPLLVLALQGYFCGHH